MLDSQLTVRASARILLVLLALACPSRNLQALEPSAEEATVWLRQYLEIDTSTTAGAARAGTWLRQLLHRAGVTTQWIVSPSGQPFLYALAEGSTAGAPALMLLHHLDAVPPGDGWTHDPHGAEEVEGNLFGRGAIDDKSLGIAQLVSFLRYRKSAPAPMALALLAVGGEETGGLEGMGWLIGNHPELFENVTAVLTEGGTNRLYGEHLGWWGVEVAQKRPLWMLATSTGRPGHGSSINLHSAPHRLVRGLARVVDRPVEFRLTAEARLFLQSLKPYESPAFQSVVSNLESILAQPDPALRLMPGMPNLLADSIQVNVLEAGEDLNVTPESARARIDVRLLPDTDEDAFLTELQELAGADVELEVLLSAPRSAPSPVDHPIFACLRDELSTTAPVVPAFISAITDARFLRQQGIPAYGFMPFALGGKALRGIHASDEHIPVAAFSQGVETLWNVVLRCTRG